MQVLRGVAAWLVVFHHGDYRPESPVRDLFGSYGGYGVDIFFAISGFIMVYVIGSRDDGAGSFALRRLLRIVPAYWSATLVLIAAQALLPDAFTYTGWTPASLLESLLFIPNANPVTQSPDPTLVIGWTLNLEVFFYLVLTLGLALSRRHAVLLCAAILCAAPLVWSKSWPYAPVLASRKLYEFVLGMGIGHAYTALPALRARAERSFWLPLLLTLTALYCFRVERAEVRPLLAGGLLVAGLCWEPRLRGRGLPWLRPLAWLGQVSYSTYLFHLIVIGVFGHFLGKPESSLAELLRLGLLTLLVLGVSQLGYRYIEDGALVRRLRTRLLPRP